MASEITRGPRKVTINQQDQDQQGEHGSEAGKHRGPQKRRACTSGGSAAKEIFSSVKALRRSGVSKAVLQRAAEVTPFWAT